MGCMWRAALKGIIHWGGLVTSVMVLVLPRLSGLLEEILQLCDLPAADMMDVLMSVPVQFLPL